MSPIRLKSPPRIASPPQRQAVSNRKENAPPSPRTAVADRSSIKRSNLPTPQGPRKRADTLQERVSPYKTAGLRERPLATNGVESPGPRSQLPATGNTPKIQKLKMQNPQKLRERVQNEKKAIATAESSLQAELTMIGREISSPRASPTKNRPTSAHGNSKSISSPQPSNSTLLLGSRVRTMSEKVSTTTADLNSKVSALEKDIESSLIVSERRAKKLDELYREACAENEALYRRFNDELSKMSKDVRQGTGDSAMKDQLWQALDELARVKKENMRLKREVGGLKAQQVGPAELGK